jgi:hypothetical protein
LHKDRLNFGIGNRGKAIEEFVGFLGIGLWKKNKIKISNIEYPIRNKKQESKQRIEHLADESIFSYFLRLVPYLLFLVFHSCFNHC